MTVDPIVVAMLAGVAWLEGVRRVPAGARVLRQQGRRWELARPTRLVGDFAAVSWSVALAPALVLAGDGGTPVRALHRDAMLLRARRWRVRRALVASRLVAALLLAVIVLGVPGATARWRVWGLAGALACAFALSAVAAALVLAALRRLDVPWGAALRAAAPLAWPFSALRAAELVMAHTARGVAEVLVIRELVGDAALLAAARPALYDARHGRPHPDEVPLSHPELAAAFEPSAIDELLGAPPADWESGVSAYCPRCAAVYVASAVRCAECRGGIPLRRGGVDAVLPPAVRAVAR